MPNDPGCLAIVSPGIMVSIGCMTVLASRSLLDITLERARKDMPVATTPRTAESGPVQDSVINHAQPFHDARGSLFEILRTGWRLDDKPLDQVYAATLKPGIVKGWALHKKHDDRYFLISGAVDVVLYDVRPDSMTYGEVHTVRLRQEDRIVLIIPANVWHADINVSDTEAVLLNMPTQPYDYADPDKYRLPLDTDLIPYEFACGLNGW